MNQVGTVGAYDDYLLPKFLGLRVLNRTAPANQIDFKPAATGAADRLLALKSRTYRLPQREHFNSLAPNGSGDDVIYISYEVNLSRIDEIRAVLRSFEGTAEGWDGPDSQRPLAGTVGDALEVLQNWASDIDTPEPALAFDGTIALELYDAQGYTRGGIDFIGDHQAVYTVVRQSSLIDSGTFDAASPREIIGSVAKMRRALLFSDI